MKDHYKTLGVGRDAPLPEIKKAFRQLAFRYHPDKNPDNKLAAAQFRELAEAYRVLSDADRRAAYDLDRMLNGQGTDTDYREAVTPEWLLQVCRELNDSLATMDLHRISHGALQQYILLILEDAHLAILYQEGSKEVRRAIIGALLKAARHLEAGYLAEIRRKLDLLAQDDTEALQVIAKEITQYEQEARYQRTFPYIVILITLALCVAMYFFGNSR